MSMWSVILLLGYDNGSRLWRCDIYEFPPEILLFLTFLLRKIASCFSITKKEMMAQMFSFLLLISSVCK